MNKKAIASHITVAAIATLVTYFYLPTKTKKVTIKEEVIKEVEVVKEVEVEKVVTKEVTKIVNVSEKKIKREWVKPDGTTYREEIYESNSQQLERLVAQERERAENLIREKKAEFISKYTREVTKTNKKRFNISVGYNPFNASYSGSFNATILGPVTAGVIVSDNNFYPAIGLTF